MVWPFGKKEEKTPSEEAVDEDAFPEEEAPVDNVEEDARDMDAGREPLRDDGMEEKEAPKKREWEKIGVSGLDGLLEKGIPKGSTILVAGGCGTGKTILGLQAVAHACKEGKKTLYMSFEESEERLRQHMRDFGWNPDELERKGLLVIKRMNVLDVSRSVEGLLEKAKGKIEVEVTPLALPEGFVPERAVVDSLSALGACFFGLEENYRIYIEQLFRYFESIGATTFLVSESGEAPQKLSRTGIEEFLADGVIVMYNVRRGNVRERAVEILKMRGAKHKEQIVALRIEAGKGLIVYPEEEIFAMKEDRSIT